MIVRSQKAQQRIVQARLLCAQENGIRPVLCAEAAGGQAAVWLAGRFIGSRQAEREPIQSAFLKDAENIPGLAEIEPWKRIKCGQYPGETCLLRRGLEWVIQLERDPVGPVSLSDDGVLGINGTIVIGSGIPEHCAMVHH